MRKPPYGSMWMNVDVKKQSQKDAVAVAEAPKKGKSSASPGFTRALPMPVRCNSITSPEKPTYSGIHPPVPSKFLPHPQVRKSN